MTGRKPKLDQKQRDALIWDYRRRVPIKEIAFKYKVSVNTICRIAKAEGLCRHWKATLSQKSRLTSTPVTLPSLSLWLGKDTPSRSEK